MRKTAARDMTLTARASDRLSIPGIPGCPSEGRRTAKSGRQEVAGAVAGRVSGAASGLAQFRLGLIHLGGRGVSSILATVLTVVVAVVASVAVSGFVFGAFEQSQHPPQLLVTAVSLRASYFSTGGNATSFTCATAASAGSITLANAGTGRATVASLTITWAGTNNDFKLSGSCTIGAAGSLTSTAYVTFSSNSKLSAPGVTDAMPGQSFTGAVSLSNGARILFAGLWQ